MSVETSQKNKGKEEEFLRCHQCVGLKYKGVVVCYKNCKVKQYCLTCIRRWYPGHITEAIAESCPFCRGTCTCKPCLHFCKVSKVDIFVLDVGFIKVTT
ncbi:hypothetical protein MKW98_020949 [Papaver atlanticum]|uniref:RING-type domain-containing protein n=1 Tax=Papaver atlanticum TaxID=357466 RepID=A0AAD4TCL8_9MAGN|nr:hypothetical protein MKW98_020949 [Papaver atlanticum]